MSVRVTREDYETLCGKVGKGQSVTSQPVQTPKPNKYGTRTKEGETNSMTNYERGRQYEYRSVKYIEALGYNAFRMAGSHGVCDIIAFSQIEVLMIQVKFQCDPTPADKEQFRLFPCPKSTRKLFHRWDYRKSEPKVFGLN